MDYLFIIDSDSGERIFSMVDAILFLLFAIAVLYLFIFAVNSLRKCKNTYPVTKKRYKYAVLFPAYKEDKVIVNSVQSFLEQEYPRDKYDIFVIAEDMKSETNKQLETLSAIVIPIQKKYSSKTNELLEAINYIENQKLKYDNVVILDADNVVESNYLDQLNNAFYSGCSAIQTHRVAKNIETNTAILDAVSEEINNSIFRKGHTQLGFSSALIGSGMAFEYELFKDCMQHAKHVGIDKQLEILLLKQNIYIEYLNTVYTYDEKVKNNSQFYNQRRRWLSTQFSNLFSGLFSFPSAIFKGNWDYCDKLFQWMMPPRVILFGSIIIIACILTAINWIMAVKWWGLFALLCITFALAIPDYLINRKLAKAILNIPVLFILMLFNFFRLRGANKQFIHTEHGN